MKKMLNKIITIVLIGVCIYCSYNIVKTTMQYYKNNKVYNNIEKLVPSITTSDYLSDSEYNNLKDINEDFVFWLYIPGTNINYPVVKTKDNERYLHENFNGEKNIGGSIFVDCNSDVNESENLIIHGHNMKDNSMFGSLKWLNDSESLAGDNKIYIYGVGGTNQKLEFEIYSVYVENASDETYRSDFVDRDEFKGYLENSVNKSFYNLVENIDIFKDEVSESRILTLSTCKNAVGDERLIVQAKLIN